ncbi:MAG: hypothetical protein KAX49_07165 [Halanaerobiales bacterium]|nr:hypothetical protein [Halanaerobiales bacterium]
MKSNSWIIQKTVNITKHNNVIRVPQSFIDRNGKQIIMEVYKDKIVLKPIKEVKNETT